MIKAS